MWKTDSDKTIRLAGQLISEHHLPEEGYRTLIENRSAEVCRILTEAADQVRKEIYGNAVFIRGLIEISNICKNDCLYCGIRRSNHRRCKI